MKLGIQFPISGIISVGSSDQMGACGSLDSNPMLEFTRGEERLARNLCNQGWMVDISDGSVKIRITINGDSLMTKDDALVKS